MAAHPTMTPRDYFAGQALTGLVGHTGGVSTLYVEQAFRYADQMMAGVEQMWPQNVSWVPLRDYFAAQALAGLVAHTGGVHALYAEQAYRYADQMMEQRTKS